ncbi:MAG: hypothetical protein RMK30_04455 [Anaerolineae bacterium]|nr:hypothetical protein [Anaerolineae bacterium]MDW8102113.1 hypothetical protein [Anaerolineae bacterium]
MKRLIILSLIFLLLTSCAEEQKPVLSYAGPAYVTIKKNERLPFAEISYLGRSPQGAEVLIKGQKTLKQRGDSLDWKGALFPGVELELKSRIINFDARALRSFGIFTIRITEPSPAPALPPKEAFAKFTAIVVYRTGKGEGIPGTTLKYRGRDPEGAKFEGLEGYPYRKTGDSLVYTGKLKEKVYLVLNVRVLYYSENVVTLGGTAEIIFSY